MSWDVILIKVGQEYEVPTDIPQNYSPLPLGTPEEIMVAIDRVF
jgi:hypothetical protein